MKKIAAVTLAIAMLAGSAFAWNWPWAAKGGNKLVITGSTTVLPIAQKAAEVYMKQNAGVDITVKGGGSGVGIAALIDGSCDIADSSRAIKTKEIITAKSKGVNPVGSVIAKDGMAIVVHKSNPMTEITIDQLQGIYSGKIKNFKDIGGPSTPIVCVSRDTTSGTYEVFNELVLRGAKMREDAIMTVSNREVAENVKTAEGGIGYVGIAFVSDELKVLKVEGVLPSNQTVNNGTYKLARPLYMYTNGDPSGMAKQFIDFVMSAEGQKIVSEVGYVPVK